MQIHVSLLLLSVTCACMTARVSCYVVTVNDTSMQHEYTNNVSREREVNFVFNSSSLLHKNISVSITVTSKDAVDTNPVFFVVRQQANIVSWQLPLIMGDAFEYNTVSRTLCRHRTPGANSTNLLFASVDVATASSIPVQFTLNTSFVQEFSTNQYTERLEVSVTPSGPQYFQYTFPKSVDSVIVKAKSKDEKCMVLSIQPINCPVYDLNRNVKFSGAYQTMTKKAGLTVERRDNTGDSFYVVLVLKPNDYDCSGIETLRTAAVGPIPARSKKVSLIVEETISSRHYVTAILAVIFFYLSFYVIAFLMFCMYHACGNSKTVEVSSTTETDEIVSPSSCQATYGTSVNGPDTLDPVASQLTQSDNSSLDVTDIDLLDDIEDEKDIYRTRTALYVSDLSRKKHSVLSKKYKLYYRNLITISIFYGLPVVQLVVTYQKVLNLTGDEDICYYNFLCAHPLGVLSAFNNVFSNIGYVLLGFLFLVITFRRAVMYKQALNDNDPHILSCGVPQHFGLYYAMGLALMMEGVMSACYHICPSYSNFQFDTAFMYMIAGLCMLKTYSIRHPDINASANSSYFAGAFVIFLAVIGVVRGTVYFWTVFTILHVLSLLALSAEIYYMGRWKADRYIFKRIWFVFRTDCLQCAKPVHVMRFVLLLIGNIINWAIALYAAITQPKDFASYLLGIFIINLLLYLTFYIVMKIRFREKIRIYPLLFIVLAVITWGAALYFFIFKALTNWEEMPAKSRESNNDCVLLKFYDDHDVWHFLSALGLFFSFNILLTLDDDLAKRPRNKIPVF